MCVGVQFVSRQGRLRSNFKQVARIPFAQAAWLEGGKRQHKVFLGQICGPPDCTKTEGAQPKQLSQADSRSRPDDPLKTNGDRHSTYAPFFCPCC